MEGLLAIRLGALEVRQTVVPSRFHAGLKVSLMMLD